MTGERLYGLYEDMMLRHASTSVDAWEDLDLDEQDAWDAMASSLEDGLSNP